MATQSQTLSRAPVMQNTASRSIKRQQVVQTIVLYMVSTLLGILFLFPFFWTVSTSLKALDELFTFPPTWLPEVPQWQNYPAVLNRVPFVMWTFNSVYIVILNTVGTVLSASLVAYSFARFRYRWREAIFVITLGTLMLPDQVTMIPQYILFHKLGWINTHYPLWLPSWFGGGAFAIFLIRQFIMSLPRELDEAALIDGAHYWRIFWQILMPLCKPVMATIAVITFIGTWNDFQRPLIYIQLRELFTLAVGLNYFNTLPEMAGEPMQALLMAASVMMIVPVILLFFVAQRYFVQGIVLSGIKG
jgi:multiple sugar transport system permease protein